MIYNGTQLTPSKRLITTFGWINFRKPITRITNRKLLSSAGQKPRSEWYIVFISNVIRFQISHQFYVCNMVGVYSHASCFMYKQSNTNKFQENKLILYRNWNPMPDSHQYLLWLFLRWNSKSKLKIGFVIDILSWKKSKMRFNFNARMNRFCNEVWNIEWSRRNS